jgi:hypothetical protein
MGEGSAIASGANLKGDADSGWRSSFSLRVSSPSPLYSASASHSGTEPEAGGGMASSSASARQYAAPFVHPIVSKVDLSSSPIEIWEGTITDVDAQAGTIGAVLVAKLMSGDPHVAQIDMQWISDQDIDLVRPGAVFYLTLYRRNRGGIENAQELRFRRRPNWSLAQITQVEKDAADLLAKGKVLPLAQ